MPQWIKAIYQVLLNKDGTINNPNDFVAIQVYYMNNGSQVSFVRKHNECINYSKYSTIQEYINYKIKG